VLGYCGSYGTIERCIGRQLGNRPGQQVAQSGGLRHNFK
jgi:hypothetical protein